jgi:hypothetical protein
MVAKAIHVVRHGSENARLCRMPAVSLIGDLSYLAPRMACSLCWRIQSDLEVDFLAVRNVTCHSLRIML